MDDRKRALLARSDEALIELATENAAADNDMRWALIQARRDAGLTQRELADYLGVKQATISSFERPENDPRLSTIRRYATAVGALIAHHVTTEERIFGTDGWIMVEAASMIPIRFGGQRAQQVPTTVDVRARLDMALAS